MHLRNVGWLHYSKYSDWQIKSSVGSWSALDFMEEGIKKSLIPLYTLLQRSDSRLALAPVGPLSCPPQSRPRLACCTTRLLGMPPEETKLIIGDRVIKP